MGISSRPRGTVDVLVATLFPLHPLSVCYFTLAFNHDTLMGKATLLPLVSMQISRRVGNLAYYEWHGCDASWVNQP
jgi:hypothetical protein